MGLTEDIIAYIAQVNASVTTKTAPGSVDTVDVGEVGTALAELVQPYLERINEFGILSNTAVPNDADGEDQDLYYRGGLNSIEIYRKVAGAWVLQATIAIGFTIPDGPLTIRTTIDGDIVTATKGSWAKGNVVYNKLTQTQFTLATADANYLRYDAIIGNIYNNVLIYTGDPSSSPVYPDVPSDGVLIDYVVIPSIASGNAPYLMYGGGSVTVEPGGGGLPPGGSTGQILAKVSGTDYDADWIDNEGGGGTAEALELRGLIVNKESFPNLTGFTVNGGTASASGGDLLVSAGAGDFVKTVDLDYVTALEKWVMEMEVTIQTIDGTSNGVGLGIRSILGGSGGSGIACNLDMSTGAGRGKVFIYKIVNDTGTSIANSGSALTITAGDRIKLIFERNGVVFTVRASNLTTKTLEISASYTYVVSYPVPATLPNSGTFSIFNFSTAQQNVNSFSVFSSEFKKADIALIGDSKTQGYYAGSYANRFGALLGSKIITVTLGNGNDQTDTVAERLSEVILLEPKKAILNIGSNDLRNGVSSGTWQANYNAIVSDLEAEGIEVYHILPQYEVSLDQSALATFINANFDADRIIDPKSEEYNGTASNILAPDNIHPNEFMNEKIYEAILYSGLFPNAAPISSISDNLLSPNVSLIDRDEIITGEKTFEDVVFSATTGTPPFQVNSTTEVDDLKAGGDTLQVVSLRTTGGYTTAFMKFAGVNNILDGPGLEVYFTGLKAYIGSYDRGGVNELPMRIYGSIIELVGDVRATKYSLFSGLNSAPSSLSDTGTVGDIRFTSTGIFLCVATNTWEQYTKKSVITATPAAGTADFSAFTISADVSITFYQTIGGVESTFNGMFVPSTKIVTGVDPTATSVKLILI